MQNLRVIVDLLQQTFLRNPSLETHKNTIDDVRNVIKDFGAKLRELRKNYLLWKFQYQRYEFESEWSERETLFADDHKWDDACKCEEQQCHDKLALIEWQLWRDRVHERFTREAGSEIQQQIQQVEKSHTSYEIWLWKFAEPLAKKITTVIVAINDKERREQFLQNRQKLQEFFNYKKRKMEQELDVLQTMSKRSKY